MHSITIFGITTDQHIMRPSNWTDRIACLFSDHERNVCRYDSRIIIRYLNDIQYVKFTNPTKNEADYLLWFASTNRLMIKVIE